MRAHGGTTFRSHFARDSAGKRILSPMPDPASSAPDPLTQPGPWNLVAAGYDEEFFGQIPGFVEEAIATLGLAPSARVLDVATGPGTAAVRIAPHVERVVAIDFADAMLERLRGHLAREGLTNVEPRAMDGQALEFADASFDAALSMFGIFLFADRPRALAELHRVTRPGGRVLSTSWATFEHNTALGAGIEALRAALPDLPRPAGPLPTQDPDVCASELRGAGFRDVTVRIVKQPVRYASAAAYFRSFDRAAAPLALLKKKLGADFPAAAERMQTALRTRFGDAPLDLQAASIFASGVR
jgi:SAM-dependent methyltransferase